MDGPSLITICSIAFLSVFVLLSLLAVVIRVITSVVPERRRSFDPVVAAAISTAVAAVLPGARVTHIQEER